MNITDYDDHQTFRPACKHANISIKLVLRSHNHLHSPSLYEFEMTQAAFKEAFDMGRPRRGNVMHSVFKCSR